MFQPILPGTISDFIAAVGARDAGALSSCFADDATYHWAVPNPPTEGAVAIVDTLSKMIDQFTRIRWDVVASAVSGNQVWLERVDRFWLDEEEASIECMGVFLLDDDGRISSVRDYCDMTTWRARRERVEAEQRSRLAVVRAADGR